MVVGQEIPDTTVQRSTEQMMYHCQHCRTAHRIAQTVKALYKNPTRTEQGTIEYLQRKAHWYHSNHITA